MFFPERRQIDDFLTAFRARRIRVVAFGGRDFQDVQQVRHVLGYIDRLRGIREVIAGGASGADTIAAIWANRRNIFTTIVQAEWGVHGRAAGPIRNGAMLDLRPDLAIGFPGGRGTEDMARQCSRRQVPTLMIPRRLPRHHLRKG